MSVNIKRKAKRKKHAFKRIYGLGKDSLAVINGLLVANESSLEVARVIQQDMGRYKDVSQDSLAKQLTRYKATELLVAPMNNKDVMVTTMDKQDILQTIQERVDVIATMNELVQIQHKRIKQTIEKEMKVGVPFQWLTKDIVAQGALLSQLMEMEFETGLRPRMPKDGSLHLVPHQSGEEYEKYLLEKHHQHEVNKSTLEVLNVLDAEFDVIEDNDRPSATEGGRDQSI